MNKIIDKNPFEEDDFDIEYDEDFDDLSFFSDQDLIKMGVEPDRIVEIRDDWKEKASSSHESSEKAKEASVEESNDKITFTYCTTKCSKKVFDYPKNSNEYLHNLYQCHMKHPWWQRFTGTAKEVYNLATTGHTTDISQVSQQIK